MTNQLTFCPLDDIMSAASSRIPQPQDNTFASMYARSSHGGVYHLVKKSGDATLCELSVAPIIINRPAKTATLHLTEIEPRDQELCEACAKRRAQKEKK